MISKILRIISSFQVKDIFQNFKQVHLTTKKFDINKFLINEIPLYSALNSYLNIMNNNYNQWLEKSDLNLSLQ